MGRVKLEVTADASDAISQMTKLGQAIKTAMGGFDSKGLTTWGGTFDKQLQSVIGKLGDITKAFSALQTSIRADAQFGATKSLNDFSGKVKTVQTALNEFKSSFREGYSFGAITQVGYFKERLSEASAALDGFKSKAKEPVSRIGVTDAIVSARDRLKNLGTEYTKVSQALATKPVMGAAQELANFEAKLKEFSQNIGMHIAPIYITLNNVKDAMTGLSSVLNNVQQPTWVEPFTKSMGKVVSVLKAIAREYKAVKKEIEAPINAGGGGAARELKFTEAAAMSMSKGVRTFYRHVRQEFKETRQAATETSRAIRDAMAMIQGGGAGGAGGSGAAGGQRLGFGEQLWSRMRSNMYSYLTMWFGVAGAIRAANAVLEAHNALLEQGNQLSNTKFDYLGQLRLKAGANAPEYEAMAERVMKKGMEKNAAYQFAGFAAMSNISAKEAESIAPYFINNIASANDQRALLSAVAYARANGYENYSTEQIMAMFLEANKNNPSELAPTANAFVRNLRTNRLFGMSLEEQMALVSLGGAEQKDANAATIQRALLSRIYSEGLAPMILGEFEGNGYYKDEATGRYKFKDAARQAQYEEDMKNGNQVLTVEMIAQMADKMGEGFTKLIGKRLQANLGASFYADISQDPTKFNEIYASMQAIGGGDLTAAQSVLKSVSQDPAVATQVAKRIAENTAAIRTESHANYLTSLESLQKMYAGQYGYLNPLNGGWLRVFDDWVEKDWNWQGSAFETQTKRLAVVLRDKNLPEDFKRNFFETYKLMLANYFRERFADRTFSSDEERIDAFKKEWALLKGSASISAFPDAMIQGMSLGASSAINYGQMWDFVKGGNSVAGSVFDMVFGNNAIEDIKPVTGAVKAVRSAAGATTTNKWEEEEAARKQAEKEAKQADKEAKQADRDAKRKDAEEKQARKNFLNLLPKAALSAPANAVIESALGVALTDSSADLQQMRDVALNSDISARTGGNILGKAFYAYASDKTDAKADKEIVNQLVASLNEQGFSLVGMKNIAQAFAQEGMVEGSPGWTEGNAKKYEKFFTDIRDYLEAISKGTAEMATVRKFPKRSTPKSSKK